MPPPDLVLHDPEVHRGLAAPLRPRHCSLTPFPVTVLGHCDSGFDFVFAICEM
jgi:hypothetical protein